MTLTTLPLGPLGTNCYIVKDSQTNACALIDPGAGAQTIITYLADHALALRMILLTHAHFDHMLFALPWLKEGVKLYVHQEDVQGVTDPEWNLSGMVGVQLRLPEPDVCLREGDVFEEAGISFTVLHTPGHTKGSVCYQVGDTLFSGDTMFYQSYGRVDLPGGNNMQMAMSLKRLLKLDDQTVVYPGHGMRTKIGWERRSFQ